MPAFTVPHKDARHTDFSEQSSAPKSCDGFGVLACSGAANCGEISMVILIVNEEHQIDRRNIREGDSRGVFPSWHDPGQGLDRREQVGSVRMFRLSS